MMKHITFILTLFLSCICTAENGLYAQSYTETDQNEKRILRGDVNADGIRDVTDVMLIVNYILGNEIEDFDSSKSDLDDNNITDVTDVMILVGIILGDPYMDPDNPDLTISESEGGDPATGL